MTKSDHIYPSAALKKSINARSLKMRAMRKVRHHVTWSLAYIKVRCGRYKWSLQQDGAPSHTARNTELQRENVQFTEPNILSTE